MDMIVRLSTVVVFLLGVFAVGCGSPSPATGPDGGADSGSDGGPAITDMVQVAGTVLEIKGGAPIANARICIVDHSEIPCATSLDDGTYTLSLPAWTTPVDIAFNVKAAGHLGSTGLVHEDLRGVTWLSQPLYDDAAAAYLMNHAGFAYPPDGKALVLVGVFRASGGAAVGATVSISPASGAGPVYADPTSIPDPTLTGITSQGYVLFGDLEPGPIEITVSDSCVPIIFSTQGWADAKPNTIAGTTVADSLTTLLVICE